MIMLVRPMSLRLVGGSRKDPRIILGHQSKKIIDN